MGRAARLGRKSWPRKGSSAPRAASCWFAGGLPQPSLPGSALMPGKPRSPRKSCWRKLLLASRQGQTPLDCANKYGPESAKAELRRLLRGARRTGTRVAESRESGLLGVKD